MKNKTALLLFIILLAILFYVTLSSAYLGNFDQNTCVNIKTISNSSFVNISSLSLDDTTFVTNEAMTQSGKTFNYTFCNTSLTGNYIYDYFDAEGNVYVNDFDISPIGDEITTASALVYFFILVTIGIFFTVFLLVFLNTPYKNIEQMSKNGPIVIKVTKTKYVKLLAGWFAYAMFMIFITVIAGLTNNYIKFAPLTTMMNVMYFVFTRVGFLGSIGLIWVLFFLLWKDIVFNKLIMREGYALIKKV